MYGNALSVSTESNNGTTKEKAQKEPFSLFKVY